MKSRTDIIDRYKGALIPVWSHNPQEDEITISSGILIEADGRRGVLACDHSNHADRPPVSDLEWKIGIRAQIPASPHEPPGDTDSAVLSIPSDVKVSGTPIMQDEVSDDPSIGDGVLVLGFSGYSQGAYQAREGIVSTRGRGLWWANLYIPSGVSGGPVVCRNSGELLGTVQLSFIDSKKNEGEKVHVQGALTGFNTHLHPAFNHLKLEEGGWPVRQDKDAYLLRTVRAERMPPEGLGLSNVPTL
jgi:hypothetical protein